MREGRGEDKRVGVGRENGSEEVERLCFAHQLIYTHTQTPNQRPDEQLVVRGTEGFRTDFEGLRNGLRRCDGASLTNLYFPVYRASTLGIFLHTKPSIDVPSRQSRSARRRPRLTTHAAIAHEFRMHLHLVRDHPLSLVSTGAVGF